MKTISRLVLVGLILVPALAFALKPVANRPQMLYPSQVRDGGHWFCDGKQVYNTSTGRVLAQAFLAYRPKAGATEQGALEFLSTQENITGVPANTDRLHLAYTRDGLGTKHFTFEEMWNGVPTFPGTAVVSFDASGRVCFFHQNLYGIKSSVATTPLVSEASAVESARQAIGQRSPESWGPDTKLIIWADADEPRLAWRVWIEMNDPMGSWEVIVDAVNGTTLSMIDRAGYDNGTGYIFNPDPLTTAQAVYGSAGYVDGNDADTPQLLAQRQLDTLRDITFTNNIYHLQGPWVNIIDWDPPTVAVVTATNSDSFRFGRAAEGFEDVMVYSHVDRSQRYIQSLGFNNIQHGSIGADAHGVNGDDNSYFMAGSNRLSFGEGGVDDDEDADVIWHEYGHAIQFSEVPSWGGGESGAIGEGWGDFWAGSYSKSISNFRSEWVYNWDGHNPFWPGRVFNSTFHYPEDIGQEIHDAGQMWSRGLMDCWTAVGRDTLDQIALQAHFYLGSGATMPSNALAIIQADNNLHSGRDLQPLYTSFISRGFVDSNSVPRFTLLSPLGGEHLLIGENTSIQWTPGLVTGTVTIRAKYNYPAGQWDTLFTGHDNDSVATWLVPNIPTAHCRIMISSDVNPIVSDSSDADFSLVTILSDLSETFTSPAFPPASWSIINEGNDDHTWDAFVYQNNRSARMRFFNYTPAAGQLDWLITPRLDWSVARRAQLIFSSSYDWTSGRYDSLLILLSVDNGASWPVVLFEDGGFTLANRPHNSGEDNPTRWRRHTIDIPGDVLGIDSIKIAFVGMNGQSDDLYLDSIDVVTRSTNAPPEITSRTPANLDTIWVDSTQTFTVSATDADGDNLSYLWIVDGVNQGIDTSLTYTFAQPSVHSIVQCRVYDGIDSTTASWAFAVVQLPEGADVRSTLPTKFALGAAYPNPFNPSTTIRYDVPKAADVKLSVYNLLGQEVAVLHDGATQPGFHSVNWDANAFASGVYLVRMNAGNFVSQQKIVLLK